MINYYDFLRQRATRPLKTKLNKPDRDAASAKLHCDAIGSGTPLRFVRRR